MADQKLETINLIENETDVSALQAVTDTLSQMAGSLTGKNLEQKIQEYTSVYGEILLGMHNRLNDLERENKALRKESSQQHRRITGLEQRIANLKAGFSRTDRIISIISLIIASISILWLISTLTTN
ncbi:MAG: hypothetical protein H3C43_06850 [Leptonema sp. (in: Bacteria)]|nr:hypothetical protein [Leptonema sp. (in: bacteria)]